MINKIKFFRPRILESDGSFSVGLWTTDNKDVQDGYFYKAEEVDIYISKIKEQLEYEKQRKGGDA